MAAHQNTISPHEQLLRASLHLELLWQELFKVQRACRAQRALLAAQRERLRMINSCVRESSLALALQMSEMTELRARLEETRYRAAQLGARARAACDTVQQIKGDDEHRQ